MVDCIEMDQPPYYFPLKMTTDPPHFITFVCNVDHGILMVNLKTYMCLSIINGPKDKHFNAKLYIRTKRQPV